MGGYVGSAPEAEGVLKLTMSVAPVTDWRYYDSIYTGVPSSSPPPSVPPINAILYRALHAHT